MLLYCAIAIFQPRKALSAVEWTQSLPRDRLESPSLSDRSVQIYARNAFETVWGSRRSVSPTQLRLSRTTPDAHYATLLRLLALDMAEFQPGDFFSGTAYSQWKLQESLRLVRNAQTAGVSQKLCKQLHNEITTDGAQAALKPVLVIVTLEGARGLLAKEKGSSSNPYVKVGLGETSVAAVSQIGLVPSLPADLLATSSVSISTLDPSFNLALPLLISPDDSRTLIAHVFSRGIKGEDSSTDRFLGGFGVPLTTIRTGVITSMPKASWDLELLRRSARSHVKGRALVSARAITSRDEAAPYFGNLFSSFVPNRPREAFRALLNVLVEYESHSGRIGAVASSSSGDFDQHSHESSRFTELFTQTAPRILLDACARAWSIPDTGSWRAAVDLEAAVAVWTRLLDSDPGVTDSRFLGRVRGTHAAHLLLPAALSFLPVSASSSDPPTTSTIRMLRFACLAARDCAVKALASFPAISQGRSASAVTLSSAEVANELEALWGIIILCRRARLVEPLHIPGEPSGIEWEGGDEAIAKQLGTLTSSSLVSYPNCPPSPPTEAPTLPLPSLLKIVESLSPLIRSWSRACAEISDRPHRTSAAAVAIIYCQVVVGQLVTRIAADIESSASAALSAAPDASVPIAIQKAIRQIINYLAHDNSLATTAAPLLCSEAFLAPLVSRWLSSRCDEAQAWADRAVEVAGKEVDGGVSAAVVDVFTVAEAVVDVVAGAVWSHSPDLRRWSLLLARLISLTTERLAIHLWRRFVSIASSVSTEAAVEVGFHEALARGPGSNGLEVEKLVAPKQTSNNGRSRSISPITELTTAAVGVFRRNSPKTPPSSPASSNGRDEGGEEERRRYDARFGRIRVEHRKGKSEWGRMKSVKGATPPLPPRRPSFSVAEEHQQVVCWDREDRMDRRMAVAGGVRARCEVRAVKSADGRWSGGKVLEGEKALGIGDFTVELGPYGGPALEGTLGLVPVTNDGEGWEVALEWWREKSAKVIGCWVDAIEATIVNEICRDLSYAFYRFLKAHKRVHKNPLKNAFMPTRDVLPHTSSDAEFDVAPLTSFLDANLSALAGALSDGNVEKLSRRVWDVTVRSLEQVVVVGVDEMLVGKRHDGRTLSVLEVGQSLMVTAWLEVLELFFNCDGEGIPSPELQSNKHYRSLKVLLTLHDVPGPQLHVMYQSRLAEWKMFRETPKANGVHDMAQGVSSGPRGSANLGDTIDSVSSIAGAGGGPLQDLFLVGLLSIMRSSDFVSGEYVERELERLWRW
ncbi:hypothetical protein HDU93_007946 [Gonapodya sp. JEL0774]|nr:hypothetical protein HDU93_007946 [Gonapodya sp. JEL0774]